jgi:hypothetical protein
VPFTAAKGPAGSFSEIDSTGCGEREHMAGGRSAGPKPSAQSGERRDVEQKEREAGNKVADAIRRTALGRPAAIAAGSCL